MNTPKTNDGTLLKSNALFACPFCGWKNVKYVKNSSMWEGMMHEIHCVGCDTVMSDYSLAQVTEKWNTRVEANDRGMPAREKRIMKPENELPPQTATESLAGQGLASPSCSPRPIGKIGNYYGSLSVKTEGGKHYWSIENWDGDYWEEIPAELFDALNAFEDSKANA